MDSSNGSTVLPLNNSRGAVEAVEYGFQPVPLRTGTKRPVISGWTKLRWENSPEGLQKVRKAFNDWADEGNGGLGVLTGEPSGNLVDIDLDHPKAVRLRNYFLPPTTARSGTDSRPSTHYWYRAEPDTLQITRTYTLPRDPDNPNSEMLVEYRSTGGQTAVPGNVHDNGDNYIWDGQPWGGPAGPATVNGRVLAVQTALLGFCSLLLEYWPRAGGRHEAYLALAGSLLRIGDSGVHPWWERNISVVIEALADVSGDEDGAESRVSETVGTTVRRLHEGRPVAGWGKLAEILGKPAADQARVILADIESLAGLPPRTSGSYSLEKVQEALNPSKKKTSEAGSVSRERLVHVPGHTDTLNWDADPADGEKSETVEEELDPLDKRQVTWEAVDLEPYLTGQVQEVVPAVLQRDDGEYLLYPGRLNMLYGPSEAAKSWLAMYTCVQVLNRGERVIYLDLEDEPVNAIQKMRLLGASIDDLSKGFAYVRPEEPLSPMQRNKWGAAQETDAGKQNNAVFQNLLELHDPSLIVADGMTMLYGLHGLDTNDTSQTDIITTWLKSLSRNGRSTVLVVDHTAKNPQRGSMPIGSQHKAAMVQGAMLQTLPVQQPMPGAVGEVDLILLKDRPGKVREISEKSGEKAQLAAKFYMDSTDVTRVEVSLEAPPKSATGKPQLSKVELDLRTSREAEKAALAKKYEDRVLEQYANTLGKTLKMAEIMDGTCGDNPSPTDTSRTRAAVTRLIVGGYLVKEGSTRSATYTLAIAEN